MRNFSTMSCLLILVEYIYKESYVFLSSFGTALSLVCNFTLNEKINLKEKKQQKIVFNWFINMTVVHILCFLELLITLILMSKHFFLKGLLKKNPNWNSFMNMKTHFQISFWFLVSGFNLNISTCTCHWLIEVVRCGKKLSNWKISSQFSGGSNLVKINSTQFTMRASHKILRN